MRRWGPLIAVCLGTFMLLLDVTIVAVAVPDIAGRLGASLTDLQWVIDSYALALAAVLLGAGSTADIAGRRRVYVIGTVVFTLASLACGSAPNAATLIAARGVQGLGGAAMFATTLSILGTVYTGRMRKVAFGVWGAVAGGAAACGPVLGGLITEGWGWRWIFLVNVPVAVLTIALTLRVVPESRGRIRRVDGPGVVTFTLTAAALTYGVIRADRIGWSSEQTMIALAVAAAGLIAFVTIERRTADPMLDLSLLRRPSFVAILGSAFALQAASFAVLPYTSLWLQTVLGLSPVRAGLVFLPLSLAAFVTAAAGGRLLHRVAARWTLGIGLFLIAAGALAESTLDGSSRWTATVLGFVLIGIGVGVVSPAVSDAALAAAPPERAGMAGGAVNTVRQLGYALGVAIFGSLAVGRMQTGLAATPDPSAAARAVSSGGASALLAHTPAAGRAELDQAIHAAFTSGLDIAAVAAAVLALVAGLAALLLVRPAVMEIPVPELSTVE